MPDTMSSSTASKNAILGREISIFKNSVMAPLAEAHKCLHSLGGGFVREAANLISFSRMMDAVTGDTRVTDYIATNSKLGFVDKEHKNLHKIFPRFPLDVSDIEGVFYDAVDSLQSLISVLGNLFAGGHDELKKIIILLEDFAAKLKRMVMDTALKVYMHTKIEMIVKSQQNLRVA